MGLEGRAVLMEPGSRWWPKGSTVGSSLISNQLQAQQEARLDWRLRYLGVMSGFAVATAPVAIR